MVSLSEVLNRNGLQSWSRVSEDTRENLSQVSWIREKVQFQDKDAQALQGAGSWSAAEGRLTDSPEPSSRRQGDDADSNSIDLEAEIEVPEFSVRITSENEPPGRPIGDVLGDVRESFENIKDQLRNSGRAATAPAALEVLNQEFVSRLGRSSAHSLSRYLSDWSIQPWTVPPTTEASPKNPISKGKQREVSRPQLKRPRSWIPSHLIHKQHRHGSFDSQKCELQLFPAEMATRKNWELIQRKLPDSIRKHCIFKDDCWWYDGDPTKLSGLSREKNSPELAPGMGDSANASHPVIQKGSVTIAGRPLLIERCFTHNKSSAAWTCQPNDNMMTDALIPESKDGDPIVVPLAPIAVPQSLKWNEVDPLGEKIINPRSFSKGDLKDIAEVLRPREFCLYLDGTLQVVISRKELQKIKTFPMRIGGLKVCFSNCVASSIQMPPSRSRISKLALASESTVEGLVRRSRGHGKNRTRKRPSSRAAQVPGKHTTAHSASSQSAPTESQETASGTRTLASTNTSVPPSVEGSSSDRVALSADIQQPDQNVPSGAPTGSTIHLSPPGVASLPPTSPPRPSTKSHIPCEVIVGKSLDLGVSCFVGVKIRDGTTEKITIPTSAALEAVCKARRASRAVERIIHRDRPVSVIGLNVWNKAEPHRKEVQEAIEKELELTKRLKIGTITRCFDCEDGRVLTMHSIHPDDLLYDVCLVEGEGTDPFVTITSPCRQWWVNANITVPEKIVESTLLHIVCPGEGRDPAVAVDGTRLAKFAHGLQPIPHTLANAVYQGVRVAPQGQPYINESKHGHNHLIPRAKRLVPKTVLCTSTLYRFLGTVDSWDKYRGAAVVEVNKTTKAWESVVGLHSFEYLVKTKGGFEHDASWRHVEKGLLAGSLSFWGCRHPPEDLIAMDLVGIGVV